MTKLEDYQRKLCTMSEDRVICEVQAIRREMMAIDAQLVYAEMRYEACKLRLEYLDRINFDNVTRRAKELEKE